MLACRLRALEPLLTRRAAAWHPLSPGQPARCCTGAPGPAEGAAAAQGAGQGLRGGPSQYVRGPEAALLRPPLQRYLADHTRQPGPLQGLRAASEAAHGARACNLVAPEQAQLLAWLVEALSVRRALEVGAFTGYSALAIAQALPPGGRLTVCERVLGPLALGRPFWEQAGVADRIEVLEGAAEDTLQRLLDEGQAGAYDFAFLDAAKRAYGPLFELLLALVRPGGVVVVDDVLWHGKVADPQDDTKVTAAVRAFNAALLADERISLSLLPVGDGMALCRKR